MTDLIHYDKISIKSSPIHQFYNIHLKLWYIEIINRKNKYSKYIFRIPIRWLQFHCNESIIISHPKPSLPFCLFFSFFFNPKLHTHRDALMLARGLHFARTQISFLSKRDRLATFTSHFILIRPVCFPPMRSYQSLFLSLPLSPPLWSTRKTTVPENSARACEMCTCARKNFESWIFQCQQQLSWLVWRTRERFFSRSKCFSFFLFFCFCFFFFFRDIRTTRRGGFYGFWYSDSLFLCVDFNVSSLSFSLYRIKTKDSWSFLSLIWF